MLEFGRWNRKGGLVMKGKFQILTGRGDLKSALVVSLIIMFMVCFVRISYGATAKEIETKVDAALQLFNEVKGGTELLQKAKGVLVLPGIIKAGLIVGGEYGEGALRVGGKTVDYYSIGAGSLGLQIGGQRKNVIICFMEEEALSKFRASAGWKVSGDGSAAAFQTGAGVSADMLGKDAVVTVIFGQRGLMANITIEGAKLTKIVR